MAAEARNFIPIGKVYLETSSQMTLEETRRIPLIFHWPTDSHVVLRGEGLHPDLEGVRIDLAKDTVTTEHGELSIRSAIDNTSSESPTGPWKGVQWKHESGDEEFISGQVIKLALGRLENSGEGILYYDAKVIEKREMVHRATVILYYPLP